MRVCQSALVETWPMHGPSPDRDVLQLLGGNKDAHTVKVSYLEHPVTARFLRLHVQAWHNHPSLKMDIIGCQSKSHQVYYKYQLVISFLCCDRHIYCILYRH